MLERNRIARELHDIIAHSVSVMVVQAGAARRMVATDPGRTRTSLEAIESTGREALSEMRRLLGIMRSPEEDEVALAPAPGIAGLEVLVDNFFNIALLVFAGVALFVGAFIIHNTFSITVAQRTKEFALLRALGASGGQVMASVLIEALIVGLIASAVGLGVGGLTAMGLQALLSAFGIDLPSTGLTLLPRTVVVALTLGTLVSVVSSLLPARRAARVSPMQALRESAQEPTGFSTKRAVGGGVITAVGAAILFFGLFGSGSNKASVVGFGAFVTFLGVAALAPLITRPLAAAIGAPMARLLGISGRLARANAARNPKRTAASASALMIGLALVSLVGIFAASLKATTDQVLEESLKADFLVTGPSTAGPSLMSPQIAADIREGGEFSAVAPTRLGQWRRNSSHLLYLLATDPATFGEVATLGETRGRLRDLEQGGVFLYDQTAEGLGLDVGDTLEMEFAASVHKNYPWRAPSVTRRSSAPTT